MIAGQDVVRASASGVKVLGTEAVHINANTGHVTVAGGSMDLHTDIHAPKGEVDVKGAPSNCSPSLLQTVQAMHFMIVVRLSKELKAS